MSSLPADILDGSQPLGITTIPEEILLLIAECLSARPPMRIGTYKGSSETRPISKGLLGLSSTCTRFYRLFQPDRYRNVYLGGRQIDLEFALWLTTSPSNARQLIQNLHLHSLCPLHETLSKPYAHLISTLSSLQSISYSALGHPLPPLLAAAISARRLHPNLETFECHANTLQTIEAFVNVPARKAMRDLKHVALHEPKSYWQPVELLDMLGGGGGEDDVEDDRPPNHLIDHPMTAWPGIEKLLCKKVSTFLFYQSSTLETLDLRLNPYFEVFTSSMLLRSATPSSSSSNITPRLNRLHPFSSQAEISYNLSHVIFFPFLTSLILPALDLCDPIFPTLLLASPNLVSLSLTHTAIPLPQELVPHADHVARQMYIPEGALGKLKSFKLTVKPALMFAMFGLRPAGGAPEESIVVDVVNGLEGKMVKELEICGLKEIIPEEMRVIADGLGPSLEELTVEANRWGTEEESVDEFFTALAPLQSLRSFRFNLPPSSTSPPNEIPDVRELLDDLGLEPIDVCQELHDFFYEEIDKDDDWDDEDADADEEDGTDEEDEDDLSEGEKEEPVGREEGENGGTGADASDAGSRGIISESGVVQAAGAGAGWDLNPALSMDEALRALMGRGLLPQQASSGSAAPPFEASADSISSIPSNLDLVDPTQIAMPPSPSPSTSDASSDDDDDDESSSSTTASSGAGNPNLQHFVLLISDLAVQNASLKSVRWTFDRAFYSLRFTITPKTPFLTPARSSSPSLGTSREQEGSSSLSGEAEREGEPEVTVRLDCSQLEDLAIIEMAHQMEETERMEEQAQRSEERERTEQPVDGEGGGGDQEAVAVDGGVATGVGDGTTGGVELVATGWDEDWTDNEDEGQPIGPPPSQQRQQRLIHPVPSSRSSITVPTASREGFHPSPPQASSSALSPNGILLFELSTLIFFSFLSKLLLMIYSGYRMLSLLYQKTPHGRYLSTLPPIRSLVGYSQLAFTLVFAIGSLIYYGVQFLLYDAWAFARRRLRKTATAPVRATGVAPGRRERAVTQVEVGNGFSLWL